MWQAPPLRAAARWRWLEELRRRFDFTIELLDPALDYVLKPLPDSEGIIDLRGLFRRDPDARSAATSAMRSSTSATFSNGGVRVHLRPIAPRSGLASGTVGVLVIAADDPVVDAAAKTVERRLEAAGRWLASAIEAEIVSAADQAEADQSAERLARVIDVIDTLHHAGSERDVIAVLMEALAFWFDADVRVYRQDLSGAFALHACLPGVERATVARQLEGEHIWGRNDVFKIDSARELEALGWIGTDPETIFAPISVEHTNEWLLTMSGAHDSTAEATLSVLSQVAGARLTNLYRDIVERQRREFSSIVAFGDAPFDATARMLLEAAARDIGAIAAIVTIYEREDVPRLSVGWGSAADEIAPFVEADASAATPDVISVGMRAGAGVSLVLSMRSASHEFNGAAARLTRSAAVLFATWIAGALLRRGDVRVPTLSEYAGEFVTRLRDHLDRLGRLRVGGAVAVVMPNVSQPTGLLVDAVMQVVHDQVRASDVVGMLETGGAGVLLPEATREVAAAVVDRLLQAARTRGLAAARVGMVTFAPSSESPEALLERALVNARRGTSLS